MYVQVCLKQMAENSRRNEVVGTYEEVDSVICML